MRKMRSWFWPLAAVVLITLVSSSALAATLVWTASSGTVTGYRVYYSTTNGSYSATQRAEAGTATQYNIDLLPLSQGVQYYLVVTAYNSAGESGYSNSVTYTPTDTTPPATPSGVTAQ